MLCHWFALCLLAFTLTSAAKPMEACWIETDIPGPNFTESKVLDSMANGFIDAVKGKLPYDKVELIIGNISNGNMDGWYGDAFALAEAQKGFLACFVLGILLVVFLPIVGTVVAMARCICFQCGGKRYQKPKSSSVLCCAWFLLVFLATVMWTVSFFTYIYNSQQIYPQLPKMRDYVTDQMQGAKVFIKNTKSELHCMVDGVKESISGNIHNVTDNLDTMIIDEINGVLPIAEINDVKKAIGQLTDAQKQLIVRAETLRDENLGTEASELFTDLRKKSAEWKAAGEKAEPPEFSIFTPYATTEYEMIGNASEKVREKLAAALEQSDGSGGMDMSSLENSISDKTKDIPAEVDNKLNDVFKDLDSKLAEGDKAIDKAVKQIHEVKLRIRNMLSDKNLEEYKFLSPVLFILAFPAAIMVAALAVFMLCGIVSQHSDDKDRKPYDRTGPSHTAGRALLVAGYASFIVGSIVALLTLLTFVLGYSAETVICKPLFKERDPKLLAFATKSIQRVKKGLNLDVEVLLERCENNEAIYTAAQLDALEKLPKIEIPAPKFDLDMKMVEDAKVTMEKLHKDISGSVGSMDKYVEILKKDIATVSNLKATSTYLDQISSEADKIESFLQRVASTTEKANNYDDLKASALRRVSRLDDSMKSAADSIQKLIDGLDIDLDGISKALPAKIASSVKSGVSKSVDELKHSVAHDFAKCRPLYDLWNNIGKIVCEGVMPPINGVWFSLGIGVGAVIPTIVGAFLLSAYFLRMNAKYYEKM